VTRWIGQKIAEYFAKIALFEHLTFIKKYSPFCRQKTAIFLTKNLPLISFCRRFGYKSPDLVTLDCACVGCVASDTKCN
jgi:hypothetical protein